MQWIAALTAELCELNKSLASRLIVDDENQLCGRKRERGDLQT
jgi:hypothetical protein